MAQASAEMERGFAPRQPLGDLSHLSHREVIDITNILTLRHIEQSLQGSHPIDSPELQARAAELQQGIAEFYHKTQTKEGIAIRLAMAQKIQRADHLYHKYATKKTVEEQFAWRLAAFEGLNAFSDFDLTWTDRDTYNIKAIPGSKHAEALLAQHGRNIFPHVFGEFWEPMLKSHPELFRAAGKDEDVQFRPGIQGFLDFLKDGAHKLRIISASFKPFVESATEHFGIHPDQVIANQHGNIIPTQKGVVLAHFAQQDPHLLPLIIGDGETDEKFLQLDEIPGVDTSDFRPEDIIGIAFALEGKGLARRLTARKTPFIPFRNFHDVTNALIRLDTRAKEIQQQYGDELATPIPSRRPSYLHSLPPITTIHS